MSASFVMVPSHWTCARSRSTVIEELSTTPTATRVRLKARLVIHIETGSVATDVEGDPRFVGGRHAAPVPSPGHQTCVPRSDRHGSPTSAATARNELRLPDPRRRDDQHRLHLGERPDHDTDLRQRQGASGSSADGTSSRSRPRISSMIFTRGRRARRPTLTGVFFACRRQGRAERASCFVYLGLKYGRCEPRTCLRRVRCGGSRP